MEIVEVGDALVDVADFDSEINVDLARVEIGVVTVAGLAAVPVVDFAPEAEGFATAVALVDFAPAATEGFFH